MLTRRSSVNHGRPSVQGFMLSLVVGGRRQIHLGHIGRCQCAGVWPQKRCPSISLAALQTHFSSDTSNFYSLEFRTMKKVLMETGSDCQNLMCLFGQCCLSSNVHYSICLYDKCCCELPQNDTSTIKESMWPMRYTFQIYIYSIHTDIMNLALVELFLTPELRSIWIPLMSTKHYLY